MADYGMAGFFLTVDWLRFDSIEITVSQLPKQFREWAKPCSYYKKVALVLWSIKTVKQVM